MQPTATTGTNANGVYLGESTPRKEFCALSRQAELSSSSSSGQKTNSCNRYEHKSVSHRQESESSMAASDNIDLLVANSIGRLIFEAGLEPDFVHLPSYNGVIDLLTRGVRIAMPSYEYILQVQLSEVQQRERVLRQHWGRSGCSVILDSWKSPCGKRFVSVFVHCREGMLFLRSMDISTIFDDVDELAAMVCHVIEDIGVRSIVQIIINDVSPHMQAAEHAVLKKYEQSFIFTVCADHCINLLLENIAALDNVKDVLMKARDITRFLYGHALPMELKRLYIGDAEIISNSNLPMELKRLYIGNAEIISNSNLKFVAVFDTLAKLVSHRDNLVQMFSSAEWVSSDLASTSLSMRICEVVLTEDAFWSAAAKVLKVTGPLISVLYKLEGDKCPVSVLYDAMDSAKEDIKRNLGNEHDSYWQMIDHIWDDYLHSPVHAAGYFLNPTIFYTDRFRNDAEISSGIMTCILRASKSHYDALRTAEQMDVYLRKSGPFDSDSAIEEAAATPQDLWWVKHGAGTPALQSFASLILGQTCFGASRYNLDKSLSERLHTEKRAYTEQQRFRSMEYIYYNLRLANSVPRVAGPPAYQHSKLTTHLGDWLSA